MGMEQLDILVIAGLCASAVRAMRASKWFPWVNENTHRYVAMLVAAAAALGVHVTFDQVAGSLLITGLHMAQLPHVLAELIRTYALQQGADKVMHGRTEPEQVTYQPPAPLITER